MKPVPLGQLGNCRVLAHRLKTDFRLYGCLKLLAGLRQAIALPIMPREHGH